MSESLLIGAGAAVIVLLILFAVISQRLEAARQARIRRGRLLAARIRRLWSLLTELPKEFLDRELKLLLAQLLARDMNEYAALGHGQEVVRQKAQLKELAAQIQSQPEGQAEPIKFADAKAAREARARLRQLQTLVKDMYTHRQLDRDAAQKFFARISLLNGETLLQANLLEARTAVNQFKTDLAIHKLSLCRGELEKINQSGMWDQKITELSQLVSNLQQFGGFSQQEGEELARRKAEMNIQDEAPPSELTRGLEELEAEAESWKKKIDYD